MSFVVVHWLPIGQCIMGVLVAGFMFGRGQ